MWQDDAEMMHLLFAVHGGYLKKKITANNSLVHYSSQLHNPYRVVAKKHITTALSNGFVISNNDGFEITKKGLLVIQKQEAK